MARFTMKYFSALALLCAALAGCDGSAVNVTDQAAVVLPQSTFVAAADQLVQQTPITIPEAAELLEVLEVPEIAAALEVSEVAERLEVSEVAERLEALEVAEILEALEVAEILAVPEVAEILAVLEVAEILEVPEAPEVVPPENAVVTPQLEFNDLPDAPIAEPVKNLTPADITDLILVTGQSNALGADTEYNASLDGSVPGVFAFTDNGWQVADLTQIWDLGWFPRTTPLTDPSNNLSLHFGKKVAQIDSNRVVGFVLITAPGMPISHWHHTGNFFGEIRNKVSNAINQLPSKATVDGILWHQGESDGVNDDIYGNALYEVISNLRGESWFGEGKPFICGETASSEVNEQLRKLNSDNDPWTACVGGEGLPTVADGVHFTAEGLRAIGSLYGSRYVEMVSQ